MSELQIRAHFTIHDGSFEEFKTWAHDCMAVVRAKDTDTLQYDWFLNADRTECVVTERYNSSEAVLAHFDNLSDLLGTMTELADLKLEVYGSPSEELAAATAGLDVKVYKFVQGL